MSVHSDRWPYRKMEVSGFNKEDFQKPTFYCLTSRDGQIWLQRDWKHLTVKTTFTNKQVSTTQTSKYTITIQIKTLFIFDMAVQWHADVYLSAESAPPPLPPPPPCHKQTTLWTVCT